jgi:hypothetical protein
VEIAELPELLRRLVVLLVRGEAERIAVAKQPLRDRATDPRVRAGDERYARRRG